MAVDGCAGYKSRNAGVGHCRTWGNARSDYWLGENVTPAGAVPTQVISNTTPLPTVQQPSLPPTLTSTPVPTNTTRSGLDTLPVLGALGLCGAILLFRKNET